MDTDLAARLDAAVRDAEVAGLRVAVSVRDLATGEHHAGGDTGEFGAASVVKVLIAARLLAEGQLDAATAELARPMITGSDDDAANILWNRTGGPDLLPWIAHRYGVDDLGSPNAIPGRWGNTHVTAAGITALYGALRADPAVWPWLASALHAVAPVATDGTDQTFGLLAVDPGAGVKQGWADGSADDPRNTVVHSTGVLSGDRVAVAILTEKPDGFEGSDARGLHPGQAEQVTLIARVLLG